MENLDLLPKYSKNKLRNFELHPLRTVFRNIAQHFLSINTTEQMNKIKLAIIIPAYKANFFEQALSSIANQTNRNFCVYIGDDCSPDNLEEIVNKFRNSIKIIYHKYDKNLGNSNLVLHWNRCISMSTIEEWIWLFSDDDLMAPDCVEKFYKTLLKQEKCHDIFHFDTKIIDENNKIIRNPKQFPNVIDSYSFYRERLNGVLKSFVIEYVVRKSHLMAKGGIQEFDLAWCSDDATWIKVSFDRGIFTIEDTFVFWRSSMYNITPNFSNKEIANRKLKSMIQYSLWVVAFFKSKGIEIVPSKNEQIIWFIRGVVDCGKIFNFNQKCQLIDNYLSLHSLKKHRLILNSIILKEYLKYSAKFYLKYILQFL